MMTAASSYKKKKKKTQLKNKMKHTNENYYSWKPHNLFRGSSWVDPKTRQKDRVNMAI